MLSGFRTENGGSIKLSPRQHLVKVSSRLRSACVMWKASMNCCAAGRSKQKAFRGHCHTLQSKPLRPPFRHVMDSRGTIGRDMNSLHHPDLLLIRCWYKILCSCMCLLWPIISLCWILVTAGIHLELLKHQSLFCKICVFYKSSILWLVWLTFTLN